MVRSECRSSLSVEKGTEIAVRYYHREQSSQQVEDFWQVLVRGLGASETIVPLGKLDVSFGEDQCRIRKGHGDENFQ